MTIVSDETFFSLESKDDAACLSKCLLDLNRRNCGAVITKLLHLKKKYPKNDSISFFLGLGYRLLPDLDALQKLLTSLKDQETYLPLKLLRWWFIFDYSSHCSSFLIKTHSLSEIDPDRKTFCLAEFCIWGLIRLLEALDQGRYIEGEAHFISLIKIAEKVGSPHHWALDEAETLLESAYFLRRLKLKKVPVMDKCEVVNLFRLHKEDRSSICVEIGLLSKKILLIEEKLKTMNDQTLFHPYRLELIHYVKKRRELLDHLLLVNIPMYNKVIKEIRHLENIAQGFYFSPKKYKKNSYLKSYVLVPSL